MIEIILSAALLLNIFAVPGAENALAETKSDIRYSFQETERIYKIENGLKLVKSWFKHYETDPKEPYMVRVRIQLKEAPEFKALFSGKWQSRRDEQRRYNDNLTDRDDPMTGLFRFGTPYKFTDSDNLIGLFHMNSGGSVDLCVIDKTNPDVLYTVVDVGIGEGTLEKGLIELFPPSDVYGKLH